jgi:hypothetical protein
MVLGLREGRSNESDFVVDWRFAVGLVLGAACACSGSDEGASGSRDSNSASASSDGSVDAFAEYWIDSSELCDKEIGCGVWESQQECLAVWPTLEETKDAIELARMDLGARQRCEEAARDYDNCYLALTCDELECSTEACDETYTRFDLDCGGLLSALLIVQLGEVPTGM